MIIRFDKVYYITTNKMCHQCNVYFPLYLGNCLINMCVSQKNSIESSHSTNSVTKMDSPCKICKNSPKVWN